MTIESTVQTKDKTTLIKTVLTRKIRRQMLKDSLKSNRIATAWGRQK